MRSGLERRRIALRVARSLFLLAGAALAACGAAEPEPAPHFQNVGAGVAFVGDAACADCHEDLYRSYQSHGMARSFYRLTPDARIEPLPEGPLLHAATGFEYHVVEDGGALYQEETLRGGDGAVVHRLRRPMDYVMGSGNAARTYFTEENGRLYQLPLTFYTQPGGGRGRWGFSPGYEATNGRFDRLVPDRCMACHNGYPEAVPFDEGHYTTLPEGIGCERCHGPGSLHVEARLADPQATGGFDATIVNPARLPADLRLDVCQQCHLHTSVGVLREGREPFDFRPSERLADHVAFFSVPEAGGGVAVVSHADRLARSACFRATQRAEEPLTCTTCHDPHEGFRAAGPDYFDRTCRSCHDPAALQAAMPTAALRQQHAPEAQCFGCHMPRVAADDAPHASFTDHLIRVVRPDEPPLPAAEPGPSGLVAPYFARDAAGPDALAYEGMAAVVYGTQAAQPAALARGAAVLEHALRADTARGEAHFLLGLAHQRLGNVERAIPPLEQAVRLDPAVPQRLEALAVAYEAAHRSPAVIERLYRRALSIQPALAAVRVSYGRFLQGQGRRDEALAAYRAARAEQPSLGLAAVYEGLVLAELGRRAEAERAFAEAVHLDPAHAELLANLVVVGAGGTLRRFYPENPSTRFGLPVAPGLVPDAEGAVLGIPDPPPNATLRLFTETGAPIRTLERRGGRGGQWDLRDERGRPVAPGVYLAHLRTLDGAGRTLGTRVFRVAIAVGAG